MEQVKIMSSNSTSQPVTDSKIPLILCIVIPILLMLIALGVFLLVLLVWWGIRKRHKKQNRYRTVPTREPSQSSLPFPPRVQLTSSNTPQVQPSYTTATPLEQQQSAMGTKQFQTRYPFIQHRPPSPQGSIDEKRPPRYRTRRKGNHKHGRGKHVIVKRDNIDSEHSPTPEEQSRDGSPAPSQIYLLPAKQSPSPSDGSHTPKESEIYLTIRYNKPTESLIIRVERVTSLALRDDGTEVDAYVRLHFTPVRPKGPQWTTSKTQTRRRSSAPVFEEEISYPNMPVDELVDTTLHIEVLDYKSYGKHQVLGSNELAMKDVDLSSEQTINISLPLLAPTATGECYGVVLLSLCFEPENRKLSLIVLRAKDLNGNNFKETDPIAKVSISLKDRVLSKLKTKKKVSSCSPIFNEAISCTVGMENIRNVKISVTLTNESRQSRVRELGTVTISSQSTGDELRHWNDAITCPGKHIAEWHDLHRL